MDVARTAALFALIGMAGVLAFRGGAGPDVGESLAYHDLGTGSLVLQSLVAALAGIGLTVRLYWKRIKAAFGKTQPGDELEAEVGRETPAGDA